MRTSIYISISILMLCISCDKEFNYNPFVSTGEIKEEQRTLEFYNTIQLSDNVQLTIDKTITSDIIVTAGENLLPYIYTKVSDSCLVIQNRNRCNWARSFEIPVKATIRNLDINQLSYSGYGDIHCLDTIRVPAFQFDCRNASGEVHLLLSTDKSVINQHYGFSDIYIEGTSKLSYVYNAGHAPFRMERLKTIVTYITNKGINDCYVSSTDLIEANIAYNGNVYYSGNVKKLVRYGEGKGHLIQRGTN